MKDHMGWFRLVAALGAGALCMGGWACGDDDGGLPTPTVEEMLVEGPYTVGWGLYTFVDESRETDPVGNFQGVPYRVLQTLVYYPAESEDASAMADPSGAPYPLLMYTHGFLSNMFDNEVLIHYLSSRGYVVAAMNFPQTSRDSPWGENVADVVNQPGDVSHVIDRVLELNADPGSILYGTVDPERIGIVGLSLGALTALGTTFLQDYSDPRIRAVAAAAPPYCFLPQPLFTEGVPTLLLHGDIDVVTPYPENALAAYANAYAPKYLATIANGSHAAFADSAIFLVGTENPDTVGCDFLDANINVDDLGQLAESLGGRPADVVLQECTLPCAHVDTAPPAVDIELQLSLIRLTVGPFFDAYLKDDPVGHAFLTRTLPRAVDELTVEWE